MTTLRLKFYELLKEKKARIASRKMAVHKEEKTSEAFKNWKKERQEFMQKCKEGYAPHVTALANVIEGLTPEGFDKNGRKIAFFERGKDVFAEGEPLLRLSPRRRPGRISK